MRFVKGYSVMMFNKLSFGWMSEVHSWAFMPQEEFSLLFAQAVHKEALEGLRFLSPPPSSPTHFLHNPSLASYHTWLYSQLPPCHKSELTWMSVCVRFCRWARFKIINCIVCMQAKKNQKTCKDENVRERVSVLEIPGELQEFLFAFRIHTYVFANTSYTKQFF